MFIGIEFFSENPLDNVISSLKFKYDKVVFYGYKDAMDQIAIKTVDNFLKSERVGIKSTEYIELTNESYVALHEQLDKLVSELVSEGDSCYFDLTGGDELALAAAGVIAVKYNIEMHEIDVVKDKINIMSEQASYDLLPKRNIYLNIKEFLSLHEATVNWRVHKDQNEVDNLFLHKEKISNLYKLTKKYGEKLWNKFSISMAYICRHQHELIEADYNHVREGLRITRINKMQFTDMLYKLQEKGIIYNLIISDYNIRFEFINNDYKDIICTGGAILEQYVYCKIMEDTEVNDCIIGCHLNWESDGNLNYVDRGDDVLNEIDILYMKKNVPVFVSCKNKAIGQNLPLYELETVADRFGGENVVKVLVASGGVTTAIRNRAEEMDIRIVVNIKGRWKIN